MCACSVLHTLTNPPFGKRMLAAVTVVGSAPRGFTYAADVFVLRPEVRAVEEPIVAVLPGARLVPLVPRR